MEMRSRNQLTKHQIKPDPEIPFLSLTASRIAWDNEV